MCVHHNVVRFYRVTATNGVWCTKKFVRLFGMTWPDSARHCSLHSPSDFRWLSMQQAIQTKHAKGADAAREKQNLYATKLRAECVQMTKCT